MLAYLSTVVGIVCTCLKPVNNGQYGEQRYQTIKHYPLYHIVMKCVTLIDALIIFLKRNKTMLL